jgi:hypothetical protein
MAKINRFDGNVKAFASEAQGTERTIFGDTAQSNTLDANLTANFLRGWGIVGVNENPTKQDFAGLAFTLGELISYLHQVGIPEWNTAQEFYEGSVVTTLAGIYRLKASGDGTEDPDTDEGVNWEAAPTRAEIENRVIRVTSIAAMEAYSAPVGYVFSLNAGGRSGTFDVVAGDFSTELAADALNGVYVGLADNATGTTKVLKRRILDGFITPEFFGATGDGVSDDTAAVKAWWEFTEYNKASSNAYVITGTDSFQATVTDFDFFADLRTSEFIINAQRAYLFRALVETASRNLFVLGGKVVGNGNVARPLEITTASVTAGTVSVRDFIASEVFANTGLSFSSSAIGVNISCEASKIVVDGCRISAVNRDYVNPGSVSSVGISVTDIIASAYITNNVVVDIQSPSGDADADGISVFSRDRLLAGRQGVKIEISGNRINDCKGRFIKLQTTEAHVWGNRFDSINGELITGFRAIDCQFGGCNIHDNFWNLFAGVTGGSEANFVLTQFKDEGNWESRTVVRDNFLVLERELRFFVTALLQGGVSQVEVRNNYIKANQSPDFLTNSILRVDCTDFSAITSSRIEVVGNTYPSKRDVIVQLVGPEWASNSAAASKVAFNVLNNINTITPPILDNRIISVAEVDPIPHLRNIVVQGNNTGGQNRIDAKSLNLNLLPAGNAFYFGTDGSGVSGLLNAATGYNRFVHIVTDGKEQTLSNSACAEFVKRVKDSSTWYAYTGTAI